MAKSLVSGPIFAHLARIQAAKKNFFFSLIFFFQKSVSVSH